MYEKKSYIKSNPNLKEEDPIEKLNITLDKLLFSLKNKETFPSTDIDAEINSLEENEEMDQIQYDEGEDLLNQFENLNNINRNNSNISQEKEKRNKTNNMGDITIILEKIGKIKEENLNCKNEILEFKVLFEQMIQTIIEGAMMKENEVNEKYKKIINKLNKELELYKQKINQIDIDYKKKTNSSLQKFNNIINNNKIEKEQIEKNYKETIDNLEKEKVKLINEQNDKNTKFNKLNNDLLSLEKEKQKMIQENNQMKKEINELNYNLNILNKNNQENIEKITSERDILINQLTQELEKANNQIKEQNKQLIKSKLKIEELDNFKKETKNILKQYEKDKTRLNELEKIFNQFQHLKNENMNTLKDIEKIKNEKMFLNKQNIAQKDLLEKYKNMNNDLNKEKEETKNNIDKLNKEIIELKISKNKLKNESMNMQIKDESAHKLKKMIENLKKQNKELEERNNELIKRLDLKEKTGKINKTLLSKERKPLKFENLHKVNLDSFIFKRMKNKKDKFKMANNIELITNRLYPKVIKTNASKENNEKVIIINKETLQLNNKSLSSSKNKHKKRK